jgi:hypothetical protein
MGVVPQRVFMRLYPLMYPGVLILERNAAEVA